MSVAPGFVRTSRLNICAATSQASPLPVTLTSSVSASPLLPQMNVLGSAAMPGEDRGTAAAARQPIVASAAITLLQRIRVLMQSPPRCAHGALSRANGLLDDLSPDEIG